MSSSRLDVIVPAGITVLVMVLTKLADGLFSRWQERRADRLAQENEASRLRREDRLRAEKERDDWREKYFQEKEDHLKTIATCQDQEKKLAKVMDVIDRRKHDPTVDHLAKMDKRRKGDQ